jgi:methyl-accepting chemotaxis protein
MVAVLRSLTIRQRFAILAIAASGLVVAPLWHSLQAQWSALAFTKAASAAIAPLESATSLLGQLQRHRAHPAPAPGAPAATAAARPPSPQETRARLIELRQQLELAGLPAGARRAADIASGFEVLAAAAQRGGANPETLRSQHSALVEDQLRLIEAVTEEAGLTRVADPAHRELVAAATRELPRATEALAQLQVQRQALAAAVDEAVPLGSARLQLLVAEADVQQRRAQARLGRAAQQHAAAQALGNAPATSRAAAEAALDAARQEPAAGGGVAQDPARGAAMLPRAVEAQLALAGKALAAVRSGLQQESAQQQAGMGSAMAGIGLLAAFVLALGVACVRSVQQPLREAIAATQAAQQGRRALPARTSARDEPQQLLDALFQLQEQLQRQQQDQGLRLAEAESQQRVAAQVSAEIGDLVDAASRGDLTRRLSLDGRQVFQAELCSRVNQLLDTVGQSLARAHQLAGPLADLATQASRSARALSTDTAALATDAAGSAQAVQPLAASARQIADRARTTGNHVAQTADKAREGGLAVGRTASTARSIADKASDVDDIAYQAHLVALNAALEASREATAATEPAAAAEELRELSRRGQATAHELATLAVQAGGHAEHASERLLSIGPGIERARDLVQQIATAAGEQAEATEQVGASLRQLAGATRRQADAAGQLSGSAERLRAQALALSCSFDAYQMPAARAQPALPAPVTSPSPSQARPRAAVAPLSALSTR